jgi:hypothetical protein
MQQCPILPELWVAHIIPHLSRFSLHIARSTCHFLREAGKTHVVQQHWPYNKLYDYEYFESLILEITPALFSWCQDGGTSLDRAINRLERSGFYRAADNLRRAPLASAKTLFVYMSNEHIIGQYSRSWMVSRVGRPALFDFWLRQYPSDIDVFWNFNAALAELRSPCITVWLHCINEFRN